MLCVCARLSAGNGRRREKGGLSLLLLVLLPKPLPMMHPVETDRPVDDLPSIPQAKDDGDEKRSLCPAGMRTDVATLFSDSSGRNVLEQMRSSPIVFDSYKRRHVNEDDDGYFDI